MAEKSKFQEMLARQANANSIYYNPTPISENQKDKFYPLVVGGENNSSDIVNLFRKIPNIIQDSQELAKIISGLIKVIMEQQKQINELSARLEQAIHANIALKAQDNLCQFIEKLTAQGSNVYKGEVIIQLSAQTEPSQPQKENAYESLKASRDRKTKESFEKLIKMLLTSLKALRDRKKKENFEEMIKMLSTVRFGEDTNMFEFSQETQSLAQETVGITQKEYKGEIVIKFDEITGVQLSK
jgi:hypothetical protein